MIIGLDVGGTHTDAVLLGSDGLIREFKVKTNPDDLFDTVLSSLEDLLRGINPAQVRRAVLSTTLTTNAIVQQKTPTVGLIVSAGPGIDPVNFRTHEHYYPVSGAIDHRGREVTPIDRDEILQIAERMKEEDIRNVGIVSKFSARNPQHELAIRDMIQPYFGKLFLGHQISGNLSFPRRIATTFLNTAIRQTHKKFFEAVQKSLAQKGLVIPIHILKADGGTVSLDASIDFPAQTILSGPSASIMGAIGFAPDNADSLVLDIGGTTTDMAVLVSRTPLLEPQGITIGPHKTLIRALETRSIGLGGDSAIRVRDGVLSIGPDRMGPSMSFGGFQPTPTDALNVLGVFTEGGDRNSAVRGMTEVAEALGVSLTEACEKVFDTVCRMILAQAEDMVESINRKPVYTVHELQEGLKVAPRSILVLGGPAPYFAGRLKDLSGREVSVVPRWQVANAIGAALARTTCEVTLFADTQQGIAAAPEENYNEMINRNYTKEMAAAKASELLRQKALKIGAAGDDLEMEVTEDQQFNMVRGFYTAGKNIRVKVQVKPGLMRGYEALIRTADGA